MLSPLNKRVLYLLIGFMPFFNFMIDSSELSNQSNGYNYISPVLPHTATFFDDAVLNCTQSERQIVYPKGYPNPIVTVTAPIISGKAVYLKSLSSAGDTIQTSFSTKDINLILDSDAEIPGFIVFNKRGKSFCSISMGLLDFPDHLSYRCLTKDRRIITGGFQKSSPIVAHEPVRKLVNDNINKVDLDLVLSDNIVVECYKTSNWLGSSYTINVNVTPIELEYYIDDIVVMLNEDYAKMENFKELQESTAAVEDDILNEEDLSNEEDETIDVVSAEGNEDNAAVEENAAVDENTSGNGDATIEVVSTEVNEVDKSDEENISSEGNETMEIDSRKAESADSINTEEDEGLEIVSAEAEEDETSKSESGIADNEDLQEPPIATKSESESEISRVAPVIEESAIEEDENRNLGARSVPKLEDTITAEEKQAIQREAEDKLYRLQDCFVMLVNRNFTTQQKQRERETTVQDLFINERANVGVSSVNSDVIKNYLIGDYLLRLERMISAAYQKVEIVFSEIHKVSNFKLNPDGTWSATVTFSQQFRGFADVDGKQLGYSDVTQKNVTVIIRRVELFTGDSTPEVYWEVLLSDIGVNQTQSF